MHAGEYYILRTVGHHAVPRHVEVSPELLECVLHPRLVLAMAGDVQAGLLLDLVSKLVNPVVSWNILCWCSIVS